MKSTEGDSRCSRAQTRKHDQTGPSDSTLMIITSHWLHVILAFLISRFLSPFGPMVSAETSVYLRQDQPSRM